MSVIDYLKTFFLYLIFFIVLYLIFSIFSPILKFKPIMNWWSQEDPDNLYKDFDLTSLAYWEYFPLYYYIRVLTSSERYRFESDSWVYFITSLIYGGGKDLVPGGWVTPRMICESIVPIDWKTGDGKDASSLSINDWKTQLTNWGNIKIDNTHKSYTFDRDMWTKSTNNFLSNVWGIPVDSPIVKGFLTNWSTDESGDPLYPSAMEPLLGFKNGISSGGWYGFLQSGQGFKDMGVFEIKRLVWADSVPNQFNKSGQPTQQCSSASSIAGYVSGGLGIGLAVSMLAVPIAGEGFGLLLGLGLLGTGGGAALTAMSQGCL